ncbi:hypothetical protein SGLAM104S_07078 [Streptomyces glaucescens]
MARAERAAAAPVCRRTSEKSVPKRDSMSWRTGAARGLPAERRTSCTPVSDSCGAAAWRARRAIMPVAAALPAPRCAARSASAVSGGGTAAPAQAGFWLAAGPDAVRSFPSCSARDLDVRIRCLLVDAPLARPPVDRAGTRGVQGRTGRTGASPSGRATVGAGRERQRPCPRSGPRVPVAPAGPPRRLGLDTGD